MSSYKALVFDIDGTAVPNSPEGMPSQRLIDTVKRYQGSLHLIAATGRPVKSAMPIFDALGLTDLCIVSGGTIIIDPITAEIVSHTALPKASLEAVLRFAASHPYPFFLRDERFIFDGPSVPLDEDIEVALLGRIPEPELPAVFRAINEIADVIGTAVPDWSGFGMAVIITHRNATKEHSTAEVLNRLDITPEEAIGIGDGNIDLHLFRSVGLKIAMGNASPDLKAAADLIAPTVDEDGLAEIIERYAGQPALADRD